MRSWNPLRHFLLKVLSQWDVVTAIVLLGLCVPALAQNNETANTSGGAWMVQLGSFSEEQNAQRLADRVATFGLTAHVLPSTSNGRSIFRVRVGPTSSRQSATAVAAFLSANGFEQPWVLNEPGQVVVYVAEPSPAPTNVQTVTPPPSVSPILESSVRPAESVTITESQRASEQIQIAQQVGDLNVPFIEREPELADFSGMEASPEIAGMMARAEGFVQRVPTDGAPASQRTDVYTAYDNSNFYAIFLAFDNEPELIRANLSPRENVDNDDRVEVLIDTFNDQRSGYGFGTNPLGIQRDGRWSEIAQQGRFDTSYEAVWYSDAQLTDSGYMVKITVPLRTLRFPDTDEQTWRIMFGRRIPRLSEISYWPRYSSAIQGRLNQAAIVRGVREVSPGRNIQLIPFAFARSFDVLDSNASGGPAFNDSSEENIGLDAKFVFQDSLVFDATLNPDFSQVESDQPQVTLNERFEVRFPERRPFFLENSDYFDTESTLIFTRRIIDPEAGLRLTGKMGPWGIGSMLMNDEAPGQGLDLGDPMAGKAADISILRVFRDISEQGRMGMLYNSREFGSGLNQVASIDGRFNLNPNWTTELQLIGTQFEDAEVETSNGRQANMRLDRNGRSLATHAHVIDTTEGFRADLGYFNRNYIANTRSTHGWMRYTFWPENSLVNSWAPRLQTNRVQDQQGMRLFSQVSSRLEVSWDGETKLTLDYQDLRERLRPEDVSGLVLNKDFDQKRWGADFATQVFSTVGFGLGLEGGDAINLTPAVGMEPELGDKFSSEFTLLWRPIDRLRLDLTYLHTELEDQGGAGNIFTDKILRTRWNYQFSKELSLRLIAQHEMTEPGVLTSLKNEENLNFDILVRYVINPWSALYLGYNTNSSNFELVDTEMGTELLRTNGLQRDGEQFFIKFSYLLQP
jgi:hypothetical protein